MDVWSYPKSAVHQAAIDKMKPVRDAAAAKSSAAQIKLHREQDAKLANKEHEAEKITTLAKTARLRAARLALEAEAPTKKSFSSRVKAAKPRAEK